MKTETYRVAKAWNATHDVRAYRLVPENGAAMVGYKPGQFVMLHLPPLEAGKPDERRAYSISSAPHESELELTIKIHGNFTQRVNREVVHDARVGVSGPFGVFCPDFSKEQFITMIAGGVGIAPFMSYIRHATHYKLPNKLTLLYSNKTFKDTIYYHELQELEKKNPNLMVMFTITREEPPSDWRWKKSRFTTEEIVSHSTGGLNNTHFYVCGSTEMCNAMTKQLQEAGVPRDRTKQELFGNIQ
ncbi:FAD-dependent oxidoreductase [Candidatus Micrarchaeota archaeon]|nr:FAD-dependent oxidoreductase [Candidatus Micrarchaeota archaeon]